VKNLSTTIGRMAEGRDTYVGLSDPDRVRAEGFIKARAAEIGTIEALEIEDDGWGTYNVSVTFTEGNEEELADNLCKSLHFKGNRTLDFQPHNGQVVVHLDGIRADRIGL
jgi:hypothetical protein